LSDTTITTTSLSASLYRQRPVVLEAMQYDGSPESAAAIVAWTAGGVCSHGAILQISNPHYAGPIEVADGESEQVFPEDWILRGEGLLWACSPSYFAAMFEPVAP
jgi:hypothetical protein